MRGDDFNIRFARLKSIMQKEIIKKIKDVLEKEIKPMLKGDGGDVEFVDFKDGIVNLKLKGACVGCPFSEMTIKESIEKTLKEKIPEVKEVEKA